MKVKKFLKGFMVAALAVTMAVTPVSAVKAAEVTVTSGASTYTFSQEPIAAFLVTGWRDYQPFILYCVPKGTTVHSQAGSSEWEKMVYATEIDYNLIEIWDDSELSESEWEGKISGGADREDQSPYLRLNEIYHSDIAGFDAVYVMENVGREVIMHNNGYVMNGGTEWTENGFDITAIPEIFALNGATAVQIPVADALAMDNANVQLDTASTQTADAQAQAAQQAADAQAAAQAQQAADAAAQAQITAQPDSTAVSQGTYIVEANDNLCKIAEKVYGDRKAWKEIYKANPTIKSDYVIYRGQVLVIPARY